MITVEIPEIKTEENCLKMNIMYLCMYCFWKFKRLITFKTLTPMEIGILSE